jgi:hypothetical protein
MHILGELCARTHGKAWVPQKLLTIFRPFTGKELALLVDSNVDDDD